MCYNIIIMDKKGVSGLATQKKQKFLMYKGHPLVRYGNIIFYGSIADKYIIMMQILDDEPYEGKEESVRHGKRVAVQLQLNGDDVKDRVVKETEKPGMSQAMEIASIWRERALREI